MKISKLNLEADRMSVSAGDDIDSHAKSYEISSDILLKDLVGFLLEKYPLPDIDADYAWFPGVLDGNVKFIVHKYGKNYFFFRKYTQSIEFVEPQDTPIIQYAGENRIKVFFDYKYPAPDR